MADNTQHAGLTAGRTALITGGGNGIGRATANRLSALGMNICLVDVDEPELQTAIEEVRDSALDDTVKVLGFTTDVSSFEQVCRLRDQVLSEFGDIAVLMNNAGISAPTSPWESYEGWQKIMSVNLWGVINGVHAFAPAMVEQDKPGAIINTGSKQGITNPPGNTAYNVTKAGIRTLTEGLAHQLRNTEGCQVSAHLLVPGFTYTGMTRRRLPEKPASAWWPEQVADYLLAALARGDFYVICPDNDVSAELDHKRIQWNTDDIIENRPALSRWHSDYAAAFEAFTRGN
jgi:NAD(P)-dependent dehydrogenase (short-subunit alcohol dehydrogenase family)